jgi:hypothetical protein
VDFSVVVLVRVDGGVMTGTTMTTLVTTTRDTVESGAWPLNQEVVPLLAMKLRGPVAVVVEVIGPV